MATMATKARVRPTVAATPMLMSGLRNIQPSMSKTLAKPATASARPHSTETRNSFHSTRRASESSISPRLRPRMTMTEDWLPQLPPVLISMGIKAMRAALAARPCSKPVMIMPVKVADTIRISSQGMRCFQMSKVLVRR